MTQNRYMRVILFFDLPTKTKSDRKNASRFRSFLIKTGFTMMQLSIYVRFCKGESTALNYIEQVQTEVPPYGHIRALTITEKQYGRMKLLLGEIKYQEKVGSEQLILF